MNLDLQNLFLICILTSLYFYHTSKSNVESFYPSLRYCPPCPPCPSRVQYHNNPYFNYPTRGFSKPLSQVGYLLLEETGKQYYNENKILNLYGRQKYPGSYQYEYAIELKNGNEKYMFDLEDYKKELYDDDQVYISVLKQTYKVKLLKRNNEYEYSPYIY